MGEETGDAQKALLMSTLTEGVKDKKKGGTTQAL